MQFIERKNIDTKKWNKRIESYSTENVFSYTWYLDATSENWGALISDENYETILPIPFVSKVGVKQMYQAPFTREYTIFGTAFNWNEAIYFLKDKFSLFSFRNATENLFENTETRIHQYLLLNTDYKAAYRTNAKRLIKKSDKHYTYKTNTDPKLLIQLFKDTVAHKIEAIGEKELNALTELMTTAIALKKGELINVYEADKLVAAGFFLKDKKRITYLKGAAISEAKKNGAMFGLFNHAFEKYDSNFDTFDFGGSDIESVATFFKKFGAIDRKYYTYTIDNLPLWFKTLKRLKG